MANIKSAKKRIMVAEIRTARNKSIRSEVKTATKKVEAAVAANDKAAAVEALKAAVNEGKLETFENMSDELRDFHFDINIKGTCIYKTA